MDSKPKAKSRNNEKRKEKSRDAARCRRSRETEIFNDFASVLPLASEQVSQLDKASIMRLAISYLRVRDMINIIPELSNQKECTGADESVFLKSLEGFLMVLSLDGDFVYLSENVSEYLGIAQIDLMGQSVYEFSHPCDHDEIKDILSTKDKKVSQASKSFFIRLKCTLTSKGRSVNLKSATYKVLHCTGHMLISDEIKDKKPLNMKHCLAAVAQLIPHPSNIEAPLPKQTFLTKHSLDMKFTNADDKIMTDILGYKEDELLGKSVYEYYHAMDSDAICAAYKCLFSKGQCETTRYRFLAKSGGFVWVLTQATLINDKMQKPQSVVCVNYVISGVECKDEIYSASQLSSVKTDIVNSSTNNVIVVPDIVVSPSKPIVVQKQQDQESSPKKIIINNNNNNNSVKLSPQEIPATVTARFCSPYLVDERTSLPRLQTATSKIFAPRTEEMSKGFLTFSEDEPGLTMLKEEPEDLTHLAPVAGDVCVPLDDHPFLSDMLDDFLLRDNFGPFLTDDEPTDPFISYRGNYNLSPQLLSPNLSKNSDCSLPSLNSPGDSLDDDDQMTTFMNLHMDDDSDLSIKAPFIPMNMSDDLPLLMSDDLMWSNNDRKPSADDNSSLMQLLCTSVNKHSLKSSDHGGGGGSLRSDDMLDMIDAKSSGNWNIASPKSCTDRMNRSPNHQNRQNHTNNKRTNTSLHNTSNKRTKSDPKEKMSSELLQQLMSNNQNRAGRSKGKSNWLLDSGGQKAACISQPSDSVLMNLLEDDVDMKPPMDFLRRLSETQRQLLVDKGNASISRQNTIRKNSISLLDPEGTTIPSLLDLTQQDYEVNAPVDNFLLRGEDLLTALESNASLMPM